LWLDVDAKDSFCEIPRLKEQHAQHPSINPSLPMPDIVVFDIGETRLTVREAGEGLILWLQGKPIIAR
jgi:hypothetical protein